MKQFLITLLAVGVLVSAAEAEARLMSTRGQCVAACGQAVSDSCGWITKRGKFNRCRAKLINKCKRFGTNVMCPAPQPPPPTSPTSPTTLPTATLPPPVVTTTTTVPLPTLPPTTTTTLPAIPDVRGNYSFDGYVTNDTCGITNGIGSSVTFNFSVTTQVGVSLGGTFGAQSLPASGQLYNDDSWNLTAQDCSGDCCVVWGVAVGDVVTPAYGYIGFTGTCSLTQCVVEHSGTVY